MRVCRKSHKIFKRREIGKKPLAFRDNLWSVSYTHLLSKILLDIDKAVRIVRETDEESEVVPNLMIGFGIDEIQAEYVAEIKPVSYTHLRNSVMDSWMNLLVMAFLV